jgi:hypothetical protein
MREMVVEDKDEGTRGEEAVVQDRAQVVADYNKMKSNRDLSVTVRTQ